MLLCICICIQHGSKFFFFSFFFRGWLIVVNYVRYGRRKKKKREKKLGIRITVTYNRFFIALFFFFSPPLKSKSKKRRFCEFFRISDAINSMHMQYYISWGICNLITGYNLFLSLFFLSFSLSLGKGKKIFFFFFWKQKKRRRCGREKEEFYDMYVHTYKDSVKKKKGGVEENKEIRNSMIMHNYNS